jgi:hypothetical protein
MLFSRCFVLQKARARSTGVCGALLVHHHQSPSSLGGGGGTPFQYKTLGINLKKKKLLTFTLNPTFTP